MKTKPSSVHVVTVNRNVYDPERRPFVIAVYSSAEAAGSLVFDLIKDPRFQDGSSFSITEMDLDPDGRLEST